MKLVQDETKSWSVTRLCLKCCKILQQISCFILFDTNSTFWTISTKPSMHMHVLTSLLINPWGMPDFEKLENWKLGLHTSIYIYTCTYMQDGSCNGLQHYAALGRDSLGARQVSTLIPTCHATTLMIRLQFSVSIVILTVEPFTSIENLEGCGSFVMLTAFSVICTYH